MADTLIEVIEGESKYLVFTVTDSTGAAVNCANTTCTLVGGNAANASVYLVSNASFVKTDAATGILKAKVTFSTVGTFTFLLTISFTATTVIDEEKFTVVVEDA